MAPLCLTLERWRTVSTGMHTQRYVNIALHFSWLDTKVSVWAGWKCDFRVWQPKKKPNAQHFVSSRPRSMGSCCAQANTSHSNSQAGRQSQGSHFGVSPRWLFQLAGRGVPLIQRAATRVCALCPAVPCGWRQRSHWAWGLGVLHVGLLTGTAHSPSGHGCSSLWLVLSQSGSVGCLDGACGSWCCPCLTEVSGWACRRVPELFLSRGAPWELGLGPEQRLVFKRHGWQASLSRPAGKLPWRYGQRCEAGSGTRSTSAHFKGQSRRPYCGGATKGLQSASAG